MTFDDEGFAGLLHARALADPDGVYARFNGEPLTFSGLDCASSAFARFARDKGYRQGDHVAVMMRNGIAALSVIFGLAKAGIVWVPINAQQRGEGLCYLLAHSRPRMLIVDADLAELAREALAPEAQTAMLINANEMSVGALADVLVGSADFSEPPPEPDFPLAIMYTSGTTGRAKGVIVSHRMLRLASEAVSLATAAQPGDVFFVWEPLYHIGGAQLLPLPLTRNIRLAMVDRFSASRFWRQVKAAGATHIHYLGGILQILLKQPPEPIDREHGVRIAWGGGCPAGVWRQFQARFGVQIHECYGMTEASSISAYNDTGLIGSVGTPPPWFSVELLGPTGTPVAMGERGEIVVRTSQRGALFPGYFDNPEATANALRDGALYTGDLGSCDADGNLYFHGRMTDSVRCRGENVSAWEVEHVAANHPAVEDCAMIGVAVDVGEQDIKLFVKPKSGHHLDPAEISAWIGQRLAPYQNPRYITVVDEFERTASQRIMKHKLSPSLEDCWDRIAKR
ncbi:MAG: AMP-binding protein [Betaproteobacteria bacterium]